MKKQKTTQAIRQQLAKELLHTAALCLALAIAPLPFQSCSDEETEEPPQEEQPSAPDPQPCSVPVSAGSMPKDGTLTAQYSDCIGNADLPKLVDGDLATAYTTPHARLSIEYDAQEAIVIDHYGLAVPATNPDADPFLWALYGSTDKKSWTTLDLQTAKSFSQREKMEEFELDNTQAYQYYKLEIQKSKGGSQTSIAEWVLSYGPLNPDIPRECVISGTSNMLSSSGILTSQYNDSPSNAHVGYLVDDNSKSDFITSHTQFYLLWQPSEKTYASYYELTASAEAPDDAPRAWKFSASYDGQSWEVLDEQTAQTFESGETKRFYCKENTNYYNYEHYAEYRLDIESSNGTASTRFAEWNIGYECRNLGDALYRAERFNHSDQTPMGHGYEYLGDYPPTTEEQRARLLDPEEEPCAYVYDATLAWKPREVTLYPFGQPLPTDVNQHQIGNCGVLANLGALAYMYPKFIESIIHENADGTYTVDLFDPNAQPVQVCVKPTFMLFPDWEPTWCYGTSGKNDVITWSSVLEKAIMKWKHVYIGEGDENLGGLGAEFTNPMITGDGGGIIFPAGSLSPEQLKAVVTDAIAKGFIITGGFNQEQATGDGSGITTTGHTWSVVLSANPDALLAMRNPWGGCDGADGRLDGVLNVFDDGKIPQTVGMDIWFPGVAAQHGSGRTTPYDVPQW